MAIVSAVQKGSEVVVYNEKGSELFRRSGEVQGYTPTTVSVRRGNEVITYDDRGSEKFRRNSF